MGFPIKTIVRALLKEGTSGPNLLHCEVEGCSNPTFYHYSLIDRSGKLISHLLPSYIQVCEECNSKIIELYNLLASDQESISNG